MDFTEREDLLHRSSSGFSLWNKTLKIKKSYVNRFNYSPRIVKIYNNWNNRTVAITLVENLLVGKFVILW